MVALALAFRKAEQSKSTARVLGPVRYGVMDRVIWTPRSTSMSGGLTVMVMGGSCSTRLLSARYTSSGLCRSVATADTFTLSHVNRSGRLIDASTHTQSMTSAVDLGVDERDVATSCAVCPLKMALTGRGQGKYTPAGETARRCRMSTLPFHTDGDTPLRSVCVSVSLPGHQGLNSSTRLPRLASLSPRCTDRKYFPTGASAGGVTARVSRPVAGEAVSWRPALQRALAPGERVVVYGPVEDSALQQDGLHQLSHSVQNLHAGVSDTTPQTETWDTRHTIGWTSSSCIPIGWRHRAAVFLLAGDIEQLSSYWLGTEKWLVLGVTLTLGQPVGTKDDI
ncbi:hypothetical protein CRUP_025996 [Coryphaenoides rupestris]|nr:hypothetical protein CRUP_025996 [Coryphaenoides rupestris]